MDVSWLTFVNVPACECVISGHCLDFPDPLQTYSEFKKGCAGSKEEKTGLHIQLFVYRSCNNVHSSVSCTRHQLQHWFWEVIFDHADWLEWSALNDFVMMTAN